MQPADPSRTMGRYIDDPLGSFPNTLEGDPLRYDRVPESSQRTELDYAPYFIDDNPRPRWLFIPFYVAALVLAARSVFVIIAWEGASLALLSVIAFTTLVAIYSLLVRRDHRGALAWLLSGPLAVLALTAETPLPAFLLFVVAACASMGVAGAFAHHFGAFLHARYFSPRAVRSRWYEFWRHTGVLGHITRAAAQPLSGVAASQEANRIDRREAPERAHFDRGFLVVALALALGFIILVATPVAVFAGFFALVVVAAITWTYGVLSINRYPLRGKSRDDRRMILRRALATWYSYGDQVEKAPGVFRSDAGLMRSRQRRAAGAYHLLVASTVLLGGYFPVVMMLKGPGPWQHQNHKITMQRLGADAPSLARLRDNPPATTVQFAELLPEELRADYLKASARSRYDAEVRQLESTAYLPLARVPETWTLLSGYGLLQDPVPFGFALVLGLLLCIVFPPLLFAGIALAIAGRAVLHHHAAFEGVGAPYIKLQPEFAVLADRLRHSRNEDERRHLWIGRSAVWDYPILLDRQALSGHAHIMGGTGKGKTARGVAPLVNQLVRADCSVVIIDLKGDQALFEEARISAEREGSTFKWFTSRSRESTFVFNPLDQPHSRKLTLLERTEAFTKALGLDHGEGYGRSHFSLKNRDLLLKLYDIDPEMYSFVRMAERVEEAKKLGKLGSEYSREHASDLFAVIGALGRLEALNVTAEPWPKKIDRQGQTVEDPIDDEQRAALMQGAIRMDDALREPSVYYFKLPASIHSASDREIGKFALYALLTAAEGRREAGNLPVYLVIDEFQQIVSEDLKTFFNQARGWGINFILANQTPTDLERVGADLLDSIHQNTGYQQIYSVGTEQYRRTLAALSGEKMYVMMSRTATVSKSVPEDLSVWGTKAQSPGDRPSSSVSSSVSFGARQQIGPRMTPNDLIELSARDEECWINIKDSKGFAQYDGYPFVGLTDFHITKEEYERRERAPWPSGDERTIVMPLEWSVVLKPQKASSKPKPKKVPGPSTDTPSKAIDEGLDALRRLREHKQEDKDGENTDD